MRKRWIYVRGEPIPAEEYVPEPKADYHVMPDIGGYQSMVDGSWIGSRSTHKEHLRQHHLIEIGDQTHHLKPYGQYQSPAGLKETVVREVQRAKEAQRNGRKYGRD